MRLKLSWRRSLVSLALLLLGAPIVWAAEPSVDKEIGFGVKMAQRGLWNEALFRFKRAAAQRPDDGRILNNLAVAYEAVGQFDQALEIYQQAVRVDPGNRELKRNYSRFIEFYQNFKPQEQQATDVAPEEEAGQAEAPPSSPGRR